MADFGALFKKAGAHRKNPKETETTISGLGAVCMSSWLSRKYQRTIVPDNYESLPGIS